MLFLVRRPPILRVLRIGRGVFLRRKYRARTPNNATPATNDITTT